MTGSYGRPCVTRKRSNPIRLRPTSIGFDAPFHVQLKQLWATHKFLREHEVDTLLDPPTEDEFDHRRARLLITVEVRPYNVTLFNLSFS